MTGESEVDEYRVPLIDPATGDGWDVTVTASSPVMAWQMAVDQSDVDDVMVASNWVADELEVRASDLE